MNDQFARDVLEGLSSIPKKLPSKYFYDENGDRIFQQIMEMPEYYLTDSEWEILETFKEDLRVLFSNNCKSFDFIEFGAGDGQKTKILLKHFLDKKSWFKYFPIDISENVISQLSKDLSQNFHCINFDGQIGDYFEKLSLLNESKRCKKVILFLGSNIGNFEEQEAIEFIKKVARFMNPKDFLMIGFDLKKDPEVIMKAYNDPSGITKNFNINLLKRINKELGGDFDMDSFYHHPVYNPLDGKCKSYLISSREQDVHIAFLDKTFHFEAWEAIDMEVSQKYSPEYISYLANQVGMKVVRNFFDSKKYFVDSVWALK